MKKPLTVLKIVSSAKENFWSQVYNAGNLIAVFSLSRESETEDSLVHVGKKLISSLEAEYFTLENKNLQTLKSAVLETAKKAPEGINVAISMAVIMENLVYLIIYGKGSISIKRNDKFGILLENKGDSEIESASGFIQNKDIIVIQTEELKNLVPAEKWTELNEISFSDFFEDLSVNIEKEKDPLASLAAIFYNEEKEPEFRNEGLKESSLAKTTEKQEKLREEKKTEPEKKDEEEKLQVTPDNFESVSEEDIKPEKSEEEIREKSFFDDEKIEIPKAKVPHRKRVLASILVLILAVFGICLYFFMQKQKADNLNNLFNTYYNQANQKYNEGQGLMSLNTNLAKDDFQTAANDLGKIKNSFSSDSDQGQKIAELSKNVNDALTNVSGENFTNSEKVDFSADSYLQTISQNSALAFTQDDTNIYGLTGSSVYQITKSGNTKTTIIKNASFSNAKSLGVYLGNIYVLDDSGIYKFASGSYVKSNYTKSSLDFSKGVSIAIDGSIYVLTSDGQITVFYKGVPQTFNIKGLDTPLKNPSLIITSADDQNLYLLDNGNQRIVVLDKNGNYKNAYVSPLLAKASEMDVQESSKVIYFISGGNLYKINL